MEQLNLNWFAAINADADLQGYALWFVIFIAKYLLFVVILGLAGLWLFGEAKHRKTLVYALGGCAIALFINYLIGVVWYHPRPFVLGIGHTFLNHAPDSSFPSDHTTGLCIISFVFLWRETLRSGIGLGLLLISLCVAWARIYIGVHYPFDILGSIGVSCIVLILLIYLAPAIEKYVLPIAEYMHQKLIREKIAKS